jgi:hypothetical protein
MVTSNSELVFNVIREASRRINTELSRFGIKLESNQGHMISRMKERDINVIDVAQNLHKLTKGHMCEFLFLITLPEDIRPFRIELYTTEVIVSLSRMDEFVWKINTVLDPSKHSKYHDEKTGNFCKRINL